MFNEQMWNSSVEGQTAPHVTTTLPAPSLQLAISKLKGNKTFPSRISKFRDLTHGLPQLGSCSFPCTISLGFLM